MPSSYIPQIYQHNQHLFQQSTSKSQVNGNNADEDIEEITETEMETVNKQPWQVIKKEKKNKLSPDATQVRNPFQYTTHNRFEKLTQLPENDTSFNETDNTVTNTEHKSRDHKPPPIFIYRVTSYNQMVEYLTAVVEEKQYYCKSLSDGTIKLNVITMDSSEN